MELAPVVALVGDDGASVGGGGGDAQVRRAFWNGDGHLVGRVWGWDWCDVVADWGVGTVVGGGGVPGEIICEALVPCR